jgi:hypothetical protein
MSTQIEDQKFENNTEYAKMIVETFREAYEEMHKNQVQQSIRNMKYNNKEAVDYTVGDLVYAWRRYKPGKLDWRYNGPYEVVEKVSEQTYRLKIGKYKTGKDKGKEKFKQVTVRHLRPYNPFDDEIGDTSPSLVEDEEKVIEQQQEPEQKNHDNTQEVIEAEEEQQEVLELKEGMMVIIPYWGWADVREEDKFCAAKVVGFKTIVEQGTEKKFTIVHRYGNDQANYYHTQKPAYIRAKKAGRGTEYTHTKKPKEGDVPYTNDIASNPITKYKGYQYYIERKNILYAGYTLTASDKLPDNILQKISKNEWLTVPDQQ